MSSERHQIALNWAFTEPDFQDRIFFYERPGDLFPRFFALFKEHFNNHHVEVHTIDMVDFNDPTLDYVIYVDPSWRTLLRDPFLRRIPRHKRVIVVEEPSTINPSLHYLPWPRRMFPVGFSWQEEHVRKYGYVKRFAMVFRDPDQYVDNPFRDKAFDLKKHLVAINGNRWSYMPTTYQHRIQAFQYFDQNFAGQFDLFGRGWNQPKIFYEKWTGYPRFSCYRGALPDSVDKKIKVLSDYKFCLCFENTLNDPGYISEKIIDAFCARCVPVYYGWSGAAKYIPRDGYIDFRDFRSLADLGRFLANMRPEEYSRYVAAIDRFMVSPGASVFSNRHLIELLYERLYGQLVQVAGVTR